MQDVAVEFYAMIVGPLSRVDKTDHHRQNTSP